MFFENFARRILGEQHLLATQDSEYILGKFNQLKHKFLVLYDEAEGKTTFKESERIKGFITAKEISWQAKGVQPETIRNCMRMVFFANSETPIKVETTDRRFQVADVSPLLFETCIKKCATRYIGY